MGSRNTVASGIRLGAGTPELRCSSFTASDGTEAAPGGTKPAAFPLAHQARTSNSPATTLSQRAADASLDHDDPVEEVFEDLLRFIFPDADKTYDLARGFEFLEKELAEMYPEPAKETKTRFADKLVKVYRQDGKDEWILLHIEIQDQDDKLFPERMFQYYYRIFDRHRRPVTALAIFTGRNGENIPTQYEYEFFGIRSQQ